MATLVRWNPAREMTVMQNAIDHLFDDARRTVRPSNGSHALHLDAYETDSAGSHALHLDAYETDSAYVIYTALPGILPDQINISLDDDILTISGDIPQPAFGEKNPARTLLSERSYGKFSRAVRLALPVNSDQVEASYENGLLRLTLPKTPAAQPKHIPVKAANSQ